MAFTKKRKIRGAKRRRTARHTMKRRRVYRKVRKGRSGKLKRVVQIRRYHQPLARNLDRDHFIFNQEYEAICSWQPIEPVPNSNVAGGDHTTGFRISMNSLCNSFGYNGGHSATNWGIPTAPMTSPTRGLYVTNLASSSGSSIQAVPDGLYSVFTRFRRLLVTHGVMTLRVSQDGQPNANPNRVGSCEVAVCGFPARTLMSSPSGVVTDGYSTYPTSVSLVSGGRDEGSFAGLKAEPNCKKGFLSGYGYNTPSPCFIRYPFSLKKYQPISWYATGGDLAYQTGPTATGNPDLTEYQPYMQCQFHSTGLGTPNTLRIAIRMKWYVTAFDRKAVFEAT